MNLFSIPFLAIFNFYQNYSIKNYYYFTKNYYFLIYLPRIFHIYLIFDFAIITKFFVSNQMFFH